MNGNIIFESSNKLLIQNGDGDATMVVLEPVGT